ncbi:integral membrane protein [Aspergillus violaceofuscus CBS 115571]|uniref:Integral membrane protein n=1 Tax=Aspergillus violaceofuscus (strain CBS 115571) TaxID=1450538 RepID=A0A2V5HP25_ASPV1|nr:integral membrane protein [Aspergillus violaceofuscus CBS 115571]
MEEIWERDLSPERIAYLAQSRIPGIIACNTILLVFATAGLLVRLFVRVRYLTGINVDDVLCIASWIFTFALCFTTMWMTRYGFGKHIGTVTSFSDRSMFLKLDFVTMLTYVLALGAIKISFCVLYLQIFPGRKFRIACWCLLAILIGETVAETFVVIFQCIPVHKAWDATGLVEGYCVNMTALYYSNFAIKLATDLAIFIMPIPKLWQLRMTRGKRMGLVVMFSLGLLVCVTSIIRVSYMNSFAVDHTWSMVNTELWSCVEVAVALFIACIPSFKTIITHRFPVLQRLLGLSSEGDSAGPSKLYGTASRRTFPGHGPSMSIKLNPVTGAAHSASSSRAEADSGNESQERFMFPEGIHVVTKVSVNETV